MPSRRAPRAGLLVAVALMTLAMVVPAVTGWNVRVNHFPPLHAEWEPRVWFSTPLLLLMAVAASVYAVPLAERLPWRRLLLVVFGAGLAWMVLLALTDGPDGLGRILEYRYEYLKPARRIDDVPAALETFVGRIGYDAEPNNWSVHVAGHPPGALLFFVALVRTGLGAWYVAGPILTVVAATTAVAVLLTLKVLDAEAAARRAAPFLALGPAAIWQAVSADAMFAAVAAWGMAALALAAVRRSVVWSVVSGLLLGCCVMFSYGLPLLGVLALAVLFTARSWFPLPIAAVSALAVVLAYLPFGFSYLEALPEIRGRYFEGVGGRRPPAYWVWGGPAALLFAAGPLLGSGVAMLVRRGRAGVRELLAETLTRVATLLSGAAVLMVLLADASQMSKAEVERIWLPFVPWLLISTALLPERWRRRGFAAQLAFAVVLQHLLMPDW